MGVSHLSESSVIERDDHDHNTGATNIHSSQVVTSIKTAPPSPTLHHQNILDSSLDDIHVPILQPVLVRRHSKVIESRVGIPPVTLLDDELDLLLTPALKPQQVSPTYLRSPSTQLTPRHLVNAFSFLLGKAMVHRENGKGTKVVPWDGKIRWAIQGCSIFDNSDEELNAFTYRPNLLSQQPIRDVWIFQYGVRYIASRQETNCFRTVRIEGLPANMKMSQILPSIQGELYCARLVNTLSITGSNTAIVTFVLQTDTVRFIHNSEGGLDLGVVSARVIPVNTATYPMPADMERKIFEQNHTRCLCISGPRDYLSEAISRVLVKSPHANQIESIEDGHLAGEVYVRFYSVKTAAVACELLKGNPGLFSCQFQFLKQYCALPDQPAKKKSLPKSSSPTPAERKAQVGIWD